MQINRAASMQLESIDGSASVTKAAEQMRSSHVGLLLVTEGSNLIGVVTDRDIVIRAAALGVPLHHTTVREIMTDPVVCVGGDADLTSAAKLMSEKKVRRLVVTNQNQQPVGVLSIDDIAFSTHGDDTVGWVLEELAKGPPAGAAFRAG